VKQVMEVEHATRQIAGLVPGEELIYFVGNLALERYIESGDTAHAVSIKLKIAALATLFYDEVAGIPGSGAHRIRREPHAGRGELVQRRIRPGIVSYIFIKGSA